MRRQIVRILILLLIIILLIAGTIEILLWTDLPRRWIIQRLSKRYGVEICIDSLSTNWSGTTKIKDVTLRLPTEENAFLTTPEITLSHNAVIPMLLSRTLTFESIKINEPVLTIQRLGSGRWNAEDIISIVNKPGGSERTRQKNWPKLDVNNAEIQVMDSNNQITRVGPLNFHGNNAGLLSWHFEMDIPSKLNISGQVALQKMRAHNLNFNIEDMNELFRLWIPDEISPIKIAGQWRGQLLEQKLSGKIKLNNLQIGAAKVQGQAAVKADPNEVVVSAEDILVHDEKLSQKEFKISDGSIKLHRNKMQANQLVIETALDFGVLDRQAKGNGLVSSDITFKEKNFGQLDLKALLEGRTVNLSDFRMKSPGGDIEGTARIVLDKWTTSHAELKWQDIELNVFGDWWPQLKGLSGKLSGQIKAERSDEPRSLEPMRIEADFKTTNANYRNAQFGNCHIVAYAGKKRFLIEQSLFELMGGNVQTHASLSRHANEFFAHVHTNFEQLDLNQLTRIFHPGANPVRGRLGGQGTIITSLNLSRLNGEGEIRLTESELINNSIIKALYNAMNLKLDHQQPKGEGLMKFQVDGSKLYIPSFYYFNRGVEVRGAGTIEKFNLGTDSPIQGYAIGLTRPLKQLHLPGLRELDSLMRSLQTGVISAKIHGTVNKPEVTIVPLAQITAELRRLLWGQLRQ